MSAIISLEHVKKVYNGAIPVTAVNNISLQIKENSFVSIMGRSGSGKSTLLHIMGTLDQPTSGTLKINNSIVNFKDKKQLALLRRREIGFVFQKFYLLPEYHVWDNICMPLFLDQAAVDVPYIESLCEVLKLTDRLFFKPKQLSGGEQQRVAIARAMANKPIILLADEPTGNLDYRTGREVIDCLLESRESFKQTIVMVTHDREWASFADCIVEIADGKIVGE